MPAIERRNAAISAWEIGVLLMQCRDLLLLLLLAHRHDLLLLLLLAHRRDLLLLLLDRFDDRGEQFAIDDAVGASRVVLPFEQCQRPCHIFEGLSSRI
ncbi:MAG: hypothetical protein JO267_11500 [Alphaproteobacteria bacterium]|nr:hypothetical protein [Alphaproteobacteria bacterium]